VASYVGVVDQPYSVEPSAPPLLGALPYSVEPFVPRLYPEPSAPPLESLPQQIQPIAIADTTDKMTTIKSKQDILEALTFNLDCGSNGLEQLIKCIHRVQELVNKKHLAIEDFESNVTALKETKALEKDSDTDIKNFLSDLVLAATHKDSLSARLNRKTNTISRMIEKAKARMNEIAKGIRNIQGHQNSLGQWIEQGTLLNNEYKYTGTFQDSVPHGKGVFEYANGDRYEGYCENGKYHGDGVLHFSNGGEYKGQFKDGEYHGQGMFRYANGKVAEVEFKNARILSCEVSETGTETQKDNDVKPYTAPKTRHEMMMTKAQSFSTQELTLNPDCTAIQFKQFLGFIESVQDRVNSPKVSLLIAELKKSKDALSFLSEASDQVITDFLSKLVIDATHKDFISARLNKNTATINKIIKQIKSQFVVGSWPYLGRYTGHVNSSGKPHGKGKHTWPNGEVYDGQWKDDKGHGEGKHTWPSGAVYDGQWQDGKHHGTGKYTWPDGAVYDGQWQDGKHHGTGKSTWPDGAVYDGQWQDDKRHGKGKYTWPNGEVYDGAWLNNQRHGKGKYTILSK
jgi:hypothetical protein